MKFGKIASNWNCLLKCNWNLLLEVLSIFIIQSSAISTACSTVGSFLAVKDSSLQGEFLTVFWECGFDVLYPASLYSAGRRWFVQEPSGKQHDRAGTLPWGFLLLHENVRMKHMPSIQQSLSDKDKHS